jgi:hypothetical protein
MNKMPIEIKNLQALTTGTHTGIIIHAGIENKSFGLGKNPEPTLVIQIQPKNPANGVYNVEEVVFSPIVAPISGLGQLLKRLEIPVDYSSKVFDEAVLEGVEVSFNVEPQPKNPKFGRINKDSITLLK